MATDPASRPTNSAVITMIKAHHAQLAGHLDELTDALLTTTGSRDVRPEQSVLCDWYREELVPHALAEEATLYRAGRALAPTALLVEGMIDEHRAIVAAVDELAAAREPLSAALAARAAQSLFAIHLVKENDLLLPALDAAGIDLADLLAGMHDILGAAEHSAGHSHADADPQAAGSDPELDVRSEDPRRRHELILSSFLELPVGQGYILVNDHDPKPLRYQFEAEYTGQFSWAYLEQGPEVWKVRIGRVAAG